MPSWKRNVITLYLSLNGMWPVSAFVDEQAVNPGFDSTLNHIKYQPFIEPTESRFVAERERSLEWISRPLGETDFSNSHQRNWLLYAMYSYMRHGLRYKTDIDIWRYRYETELSEEHLDLIQRTTTYDSIHDEAKVTIDVNEELCKAIVQYGLSYYKISEEELNLYMAWAEQEKHWDNQERVHEALQHFWRDWSPEGLHERATPIEFLSKHLNELFPESERENRREGPVRILFPGSGLGRLPHDVAKSMPDAEITANELSSFMRLAYRFVESLQTPDAVTFYPFSDWWSYQPNREELFRAVKFPDQVMNSSAVLLVEGDFTTMFEDKPAHFDAIVTFFFIDTSENVLEYYDTIATLLKPGGVWINMGPLLYNNAKVEFSLEDMLDVAEKGYGFEMLDVDEDWGPITLPGRKARGREVSYQCHEHALRRHVYPVQYFAARLKENLKRKINVDEEEDMDSEKDEL